MDFRHYLCSTGEVMKAALPAGLKVESETFVSLNEDFDKGDADMKFSETQAIIIMAPRKRNVCAYPNLKRPQA